MAFTIYHNPASGTSCAVPGLIRDSGAEPVVVEYLNTPPTRVRLLYLLSRMGITARGLLRREGAP